MKKWLVGLIFVTVSAQDVIVLRDNTEISTRYFNKVLNFLGHADQHDKQCIFSFLNRRDWRMQPGPAGLQPKMLQTYYQLVSHYPETLNIFRNALAKDVRTGEVELVDPTGRWETFENSTVKSSVGQESALS